MEKFLRKTIVILIYIGLILVSTKAYATQMAKPTKDNVRMRKEASTDSSVVETLNTSHEVTVLSKEDNWYKVEAKVGGKTLNGYIREDLLDIREENDGKDNGQNNEQDSNNDESNSQKEIENVAAKADKLEQAKNINNIKEGYVAKAEKKLQIKLLPTINSEYVDEINQGTEYKVLEVISKWCFIETEKQSGWILKSKLAEIIAEVQDNTQNNNSDIANVENNEQEENNTKENDEDSSKQEENDKNNQEQENENVKEQEQENVTTQVKNETKYVSVDTLNVREKASSNAKIIDQLDINDKITVLEIVDGTWAKFEKDGKTGYVSIKFLSDKKAEITSRSGETSRENQDFENKANNEDNKSDDGSQEEQNDENNNQSSSAANSGSSVVEVAKQYLEYRYVSGGASPSTGFDCSGLTTYVFKHFGITLSRTSGAQASNGAKVERSNLQAGDILIFNDSANKKVGHVGIYIGGNQFIHAANPKKGVIITSLSDSYYSARYVGARRVL